MKELRDNIKSVLATVTLINAPTVFDYIQSEQGYKTIEETMIRMMVDENLSASGCIPHIEAQL
tara:strand:+ start:798 stop:986 length:189 start_codon:yes stop_codon:yes gene_type:complete